ncbi:ceramidase domain-containing protein [Hydromonas duriensis]|uniref:Ceramidase n=1 Tax=Hydromonas duriensis TaxID=1527608 RepID=A0A4R6Y5F2_9BURK|nr:hypothetical protein [Hydromonas duriensis]TDR30400.1 ceramidase [Hydromonas duriensis]
MTTAQLKKLIVGIFVLAVSGMLFVQPIPQDPAYHDFADNRTLLFIPNFWNVMSNCGFLIVGALGLYKLYVLKSLKTLTPIRHSYAIFFLGVTLVAFGSGYYHWVPSNDSLLWDRLPMTLAFMALLSIVLAEFLSMSWGKNSLWPLLVVGILSVVYWRWGELHGRGDLRPYALVQFLPIILILILVCFGDNRYNTSVRMLPKGYLGLTGCYVLAKLFEHFDRFIYAASFNVMAGHAIKHVIAALGLWFLLVSIEQRMLKSS